MTIRRVGKTLISNQPQGRFLGSFGTRRCLNRPRFQKPFMYHICRVKTALYVSLLSRSPSHSTATRSHPASISLSLLMLDTLDSRSMATLHAEDLNLTWRANRKVTPLAKMLVTQHGLPAPSSNSNAGSEKTFICTSGQRTMDILILAQGGGQCNILAFLFGSLQTP